MFTDRVVLTSLVALAVGACFDPTFHNPVCGPGGDCPEGWKCAAVGQACVAEGTPPEPPDATPPGPGEPDAMPSPGPCTKTWQSLLTNGNFDAGSIRAARACR
jgi:hypothetical protein